MIRYLRLGSGVLLAWILINSIFPDSSSSQERSDTPRVKGNDLMEIVGQLVCVAEQMAKLRESKPACPKYGHVIGLKVSDGTIWTFFPSPMQKQLQENSEFIDRRVKITGKLFYSGKIIEISEYAFLPLANPSPES